MNEALVAFDRIATKEMRRVPGIMLNREPQEWIWEHDGKVEWLMGARQDQSEWKIRITFPNPADALLFKLTFGGA